MGHRQINHLRTRFGRLVVVEKLESRRSPCGSLKRFWKCLCDCGNYTEASTTSLIRGYVKSCGCLHSDTSVSNSISSRHKLTKSDSLKKYVLYGYKRNAKNRNINWEIDDDFAFKIFELNCHYCGCVPSNIAKSGKTIKKEFLYNGIDRIDNKKGYTPQNVVPCCAMCNHAKKNYGELEFMSWSLRLAMFSLEKISEAMKEKEQQP